MRFNFLKQATAALLISSSLLLCSCAGASMRNESDIHLTIEPTAAEKYTQEQKENITSSLLEVLSYALYKKNGMLMSDKLRASASETINSDIIPILEAKITYGEFEELNVTSFDITSADSVALSYITMMQTLGNERSGEIFRSLLLLYLKENEESSRQKYLKYSRLWDLEDAERYKRQTDELSSISNDEFSLVCSMLSLCASGANAANLFDTPTQSPADSASLLLTFMRRQSALLDASLSRETLSRAGRLIFELILCDTEPPKNHGTLFAEEWYILANAGENATALGESFYDFFAFYCDFANTMTKSEAEEMLSADREKSISAICNIIGRCENSFKTWIEKLGSCRFASEEELTLINRTAHRESFETYSAERSTTSAEKLFELITKTASDIESTLPLLYTEIENLSFGIAPYATYIFYKASK